MSNAPSKEDDEIIEAMLLEDMGMPYHGDDMIAEAVRHPGMERYVGMARAALSAYRTKVRT